MKRAAFIVVIISLMMSSCKTTQKAVSVNNDDVYSTPARQAAPSKPAPGYNPDLSSALAADQSALAHDSLNAKAATLDYSDVSYANRIQKFQHPEGNTSYFESPAADTTYVYSSSPNVSISFGFGGGYYGYGMGFGWGYPSYGWGYPYYGYGYGWGYPYYWDYPYWGAYPYWGYYPYYGCCYCWNYPYYNEGGYYNTYYGPRQSAATNTVYDRNTRGDGTGTTLQSRPATTAGAANSRSAQPAASRGNTAAVPGTRTTDPANTRPGTGAAAATPATRSADPAVTQGRSPASQERYHYTRPANQGQGAYTRSPGQDGGTRAVRQQPAPKYTQPGSIPGQRQGQVQNYTPGNYRQARSSQEYINPRVQSQNAAARQSGAAGTRAGASANQRTYSSPGNYSGGNRVSPSQGGQQYSSPRSYSPGNSTPSRGSSPGYSAPRSTPSYSPPSGGGGGRSGGGFSGGSGGGGGGGGRSGGGGGGGSPRR